jgi:hypothetical protein
MQHQNGLLAIASIALGFTGFFSIANIGTLGGNLAGTLPNPTIDAAKFSSPPAIGNAFPSKGAFTSLSASGALTVIGKETVGATGWLETLVPNTESIAALQTLSRAGFIGVLGASRTSDNSVAGAQGSLSGAFININDNTAFVQTGFGGYFETRRLAGAGTEEGIESTVLNFGTSVSINPYAMVATGETMALWLAAGRPNVPSASGRVSAAIGVKNNGAQFDKGLIFEAGSILNGDALDLPASYAINWRNATNSSISAIIRSDITAAATGQSLLFANGGFFIQDFAGTNIAQFSLTNTNILNGTFTVSSGLSKLPPVAFASLPTCNAGAEGTDASINDSNTVVFNAVIAGGGVNHIAGRCNGTAWVVY